MYAYLYVVAKMKGVKNFLVLICLLILVSSLFPAIIVQGRRRENARADAYAFEVDPNQETKDENRTNISNTNPTLLTYGGIEEHQEFLKACSCAKEDEEFLKACSCAKEDEESSFPSTPSASFDLVALEAYLRDQPSNAGNIIETPTVGQAVYFHFRWRCDGSGTTPSFRRELKIDGSRFCYLDATTTGGKTWITSCTSPWTATGGSHTLTCVLDTLNQVDESNEGNNQASKNWNTDILPDLIVDDIWVVPDPPCADEPFEVHARICNIGGADVVDVFPVAVFIDSESNPRLTWIVPSLGADLCVEVSDTIHGTLPAGAHTVRFVADYLDYIDESREDNNERQETYEWVICDGDPDIRVVPDHLEFDPPAFEMSPVENGSNYCNCSGSLYPVMKYPPPMPDPTKSSPKPEVLVTLPSQFNWRDYEGGDWTTPAKSQGGCGSCWDFAALGALDAVINIEYGNPTLDLDLSEQYVLSCLPAAGDCDGGSSSRAFMYILSEGADGNYVNGIIPESCFPYQADDTVPCTDKCPDWESYIIPISNYGYWYPNLPSDRDAIKSQLMEKGPIVTYLTATSDFKSWGSTHHSPDDYYPYPGPVGDVNHAVVIVGYKDDQAIGNGGYWIIKNSWGTGFGYQGFYNVEYGSLRHGEFITYVEYEPEEQQPITVYNDGTGNLEVYNIRDCYTTGEPSGWLSASPTAFTVTPGGSQTVTVTVNPTGLDSGTYHGWLEIDSNDPDGYENPYIVTVTLVKPTTCTVTFYTNPIADSPSITFDGDTYTHGQSGSYSPGDYSATANPPSVDYAFHHWQYSGSPDSGVYVPNININPTTVQVRCDGWLKAIFSAKITFHTNPAGIGSINYDGGTFKDGEFTWEANLPPDYSNDRTISANVPIDYEFVNWVTTGKISVSNASSISTTLTIDGPGALTASFNPTGFLVHLRSEEDTGATSNLGSIIFNGTNYPLPANISKTEGSYSAEYLPASCYEFDHWEAYDGVHITGGNTSNPTTVTVDGEGTLKAVFGQMECTVTFYTEPTDPSFNITFNGKTYTNNHTEIFYCGTSGLATANAPKGWNFSYWMVGGNVYLSDNKTNPTTITIKCGGTLTAVFKPVAECEVTFYTDPTDVGSITFEGKTYTNGEFSSFKNGTSSSATANVPECWVFDRWLTSGNVSVSDDYTNPTTFTIHCGGNLTAVFKRIECVVTFYTDPSNGSISFNGTTYTNSQSDIFDCGTSGPATAHPPESWNFSHWEVGGNVTVSDAKVNPTNLTIKCGGNLTAVFTKVSIVYVDPSEIVGPPPNVGENFTWTIRVDTVSDLYLWTLDLSWDPAILEIQGTPIEGNCLKSGGSTTFLWESITPGHITGLTCTLLGALSGVDVPPCPDDLANVTFKALNYTCSLGTWISISDSHLLDHDGNEIPHATQPAKITLCPTDLTVSSMMVQYDRAFFYANVTDGCHVDVNITNIGNADAGPFNVTFRVTWIKGMIEEYYNKTLISGLLKGATIGLHYPFTIEHVGNYSVTVMVDSDFKIPESNEDNNELTKIVEGRGAGDINGDDKVDYRDLFRLAKAYGSEISAPSWDPDADINCDGKVDYRDLFLLAKNYGKTFPDP